MSQAEDASIVSESLTVLDCKRGTCGNITVGAGGYETTYFGMVTPVQHALHVCCLSRASALHSMKLTPDNCFADTSD